MPDWNTRGTGGENKPLHLKTGSPTRAAPPAASHGANLPTHQRLKSGGVNKPMHEKVGAPKRGKPPSGSKGKTF